MPDRILAPRRCSVPIRLRQTIVLPEPDSPMRPSISPRRTLKVALSTTDQRLAAPTADADPQVPDVDQRPHRWRRAVRRISQTPRSRRERPSAMKESEMPAQHRARPGKIVIHHACCTKGRPSLIITPHSAVGGAAPERQEREAGDQHDDEDEVAERVGDGLGRDVRQEMPEEDARGGIAENARRLDVALLARPASRGYARCGRSAPSWSWRGR